MTLLIGHPNQQNHVIRLPSSI